MSDLPTLHLRPSPTPPAGVGASRRLRNALFKTPYAAPVDLRGRHIVVTGATPGSLGFATAVTLARWGARLTISTRSKPERAAAALAAAVPDAHSRIHAEPLNLANRASVTAFAAACMRHHMRIDVLINNAGIHLDLRSQWKQPQLTADGHELHWRTNYLGTAQLTQALLPQLVATARLAGEARIVNVVSMLHARGRNAALFAPLQPYNSWAAYGTSKLALVHMTQELQRRHGDAGLQAYCLHPGAVYTGIADRGLEGSRFLAALRSLFAPVEAWLLRTPEEGAQTSLHCATAQGLQSGAYFCDCAPARPSQDAGDAAVSQRLWEQTQAWIANT